eukprot:GFUD01011020.1.p1 GENE.GFUD01011020.1~~GFUD01011020.1.p1  ORF type:complete len:231 (+),score=58.49 GFUD01011020.1:81-773(+)
MEVFIQSIEGGIYPMTIDSGTTILELKNKIKKDSRIASQGLLTFLGLDLTEEDGLTVEECVRLGNNTFQVTQFKGVGDEARGGAQVKKIRSEMDIKVILGDRRNFQCVKILPNKDMEFSPTKSLGVVYHQEGEENGKRTYSMEKFQMPGKGKIEVRRDEDDRADVYFIPDGDETEQKLVGKVKTYDESRNSQESRLMRILGSKAFGNMTRLDGVIGDFVFGGLDAANKEG